MSLTTKFNIDLIALLVSTLDLSASRNQLEATQRIEWANGAGLNQANLIFQDRLTVTAAGEQLLDLTALTDSLGGSVAFARIKAIYLVNRSVTAGDNLQLGGTVSNGLSTLYVGTNAGQLIGPGGIALLVNPSAAGWAVTAASADILRIGNPGTNSIDCDLVLIGAAT
jgi:hypothetical protein